MSGYNTKVYHAQGGDEFVVASGGKIIIIDGIPTIDPEQAGEVWLDGSKLKVSSGD